MSRFPWLKRPFSNGAKLGFALLALTLCHCRQIDLATKEDLPESLKKPIPATWSVDYLRIPDKAVTGWLDDLGSKTLRSLVRQAVGSNYDLQTVAARVDQSRAQTRIARAARWPRVGLSVSGSRSQRLLGARFENIRSSQYNSNLSFDWEVDLWGRLKNEKSAAELQLAAAKADYQASRLSLGGRVIKTVFDLLETREQAKLSQETLTSLQTNLAILDGKLESGDFDDRTALDISLSRADVLRAEATYLVRKNQEETLTRTLEVLLGQYPAGQLEGLSAFPNLKRALPESLPSDLLLRRPDILAAENRLSASLERVTARKKALLPSIRLSASTGTSTTERFGDLLDPDRLVWNLLASLTQPLFEGGRLRAEIDLSRAQLDEAVATFAGIALQAFQEVETALASERYLEEQYQKFRAATEEASRAESLALSQYEQGLVEIITVLESQRRAFDLRSSLLAATNQRLQNRVDLYLALGGDFDHPIETSEN